MKKLISIIAGLLLIPSGAYAAGTCGTVGGVTGTSPYTAETHAYADVADCVADVAAGSEIIVPAGDGTETWTQELLITKGITLTGPGRDNLTITMGFAKANTNTCSDGAANSLIRYKPTTSANTETLKITGFTFDANTQGVLLSAYGGNTAGIDTLNIQANKFINTGASSRNIEVCDTFYGVIGSNLFDNVGSVLGAYGEQGTSWNNLTFAFASANNLYFEGNTITNLLTTPHSGGQGGRYVARYNSYTYTGSTALSPWFDIHGNQPSGVYAAMGVEILNNALVGQADKSVKLFDHRGGMAKIYKNDYSVSTTVAPGAREEYDDAISSTTNEQPQHVSGSYYWSNTRNGTTAVNATLTSNYCNTTAGAPYIPCTVETHGYVVAENTSFWNSAAAYTPYTCPHPLADPTAAGNCNPDVIGASGYALDAGGNPDVPWAVSPSIVSGNGAISPSAAEGVMPAGDSSTFTATPDNGWKISTWGGDAVACGSAATCQLTNVTADKSVTVTFSEIMLFN